MLPWWDRWPGRREAEIESFRRHGLEFSQDDDAFAAGRLVLRGSIPIDGERVAAEVFYPDTYPWTRFSVVAPGLALPRHQHPFGKNLCVFPRGGDHWNRTWLAGDIVAEAVPRLIGVVREGGDTLREAEEPQGEPFTDYYVYWPFGGIVVPPEITEAVRDVDGGQFQVRMCRSAGWLESVALGNSEAKPELGAGVVTAVRRGQQLLASAAEEHRQGLRGPTWTGTWVRVKEPPAIAAPADFLEAVARERPNKVKPRFLNGRAAAVDLVGVVFEEEVAQGVKDDAWVFVAVAKSRNASRGRAKAAAQPVVTLVRGMRGGRAHLRERIPELESLGMASVAVVGLGTLGAPLAKELTRNLVGELHVVDRDFVDAGTAVRWERGLEAAGTLKTLALVDDLTRNYPHTKVVGHGEMIGAIAEPAGGGDRELFAEAIAGTDLVLDATADSEATAALAAACWEMSIPFIALWSIEGFGGVVARIIPGETGCFHCLELMLRPNDGSVPLPTPSLREPRVQPRGCADPTFTSPAPDLLPLVHHACRMAFGELTRVSDSGYPRHANDIHVFFLRHPDRSLFEPPRWDAHRLDADPECPCHDERQS